MFDDTGSMLVILSTHIIAEAFNLCFLFLRHFSHLPLHDAFAEFYGRPHFSPKRVNIIIGLIFVAALKDIYILDSAIGITLIRIQRQPFTVLLRSNTR
jgi:hypothetical protein